MEEKNEKKCKEGCVLTNIEHDTELCIVGAEQLTREQVSRDEFLKDVKEKVIPAQKEASA